MFSDEIDQAAQVHARSEWPRESAGIVVDGQYRPCDNLAENPETDFKIDARLMLTPGLQGIIHSHPNGDCSPSQKDMEQQIATALPWGIVATNGERSDPVMWFGDQLEPPPLLGRRYRFGPSGSDGKGDCYAIIRDWFWMQRGIRLRDVPRDQQGYDALTPWYDTLFDSYGWEDIKLKDVKEGDVVLCKIMQNVTNHALLVLDHSYCLHHTQNRLSCQQPIGPWLRYAVRAIRYTKP